MYNLLIYNLVILLIIIFILFYSINNFIGKKNIIENYITFFLPYYDNNLKELTKMYNNNDDKKNYFKKKFLYEPLIFIYNDYQKSYITHLSKIIISKSFLQKTLLLRLNNIEKAVEKVNSGNINFMISNLPTLIALKNIKKMDIHNIRYVAKLYTQKIYFFTNKQRNIESLKNIPRRFVIGIPSKTNEINLYINTIIEDMGYKFNKDYSIKYSKDNLLDLFNLLLDGKVDIIVFTETYPNKELTNIITKYSNSDIILLPFECNNETLFFKENFYFEKTMIDLNFLSPNYLPRKFNNKEYTIYNPNIYLLSFNMYLLTNIQTNKDYIYNITKTIYENKDFLNNYFKDNKIESLMFKDYELFLFSFHIGTRNYLIEKSYISYIDDPICKNLIGVKECSQENIDNNIMFQV